MILSTEIAESIHLHTQYLPEKSSCHYYRQWYNGSCSLLRNHTNVFAFTIHSAKNVWLIEINYNFESEKIIGKKLKLCLILCMYSKHIYNIHYKLVRVYFAFTFAPLTFRLTHFAFVYHSMAVILVQRTLLIITMCRAHPKRKRAKKTLKLKIYGWALVAKPTAAWQQQSKYSNVNDLIG